MSHSLSPFYVFSFPFNHTPFTQTSMHVWLTYSTTAFWLVHLQEKSFLLLNWHADFDPSKVQWSNLHSCTRWSWVWPQYGTLHYFVSFGKRLERMILFVLVFFTHFCLSILLFNYYVQIVSLTVLNKYNLIL